MLIAEELLPLPERFPQQNHPLLLLTAAKDQGICRYQSCDEIMKQISDALKANPGPQPQASRAEMVSESLSGEIPCRIYGVYSPVGRCGKTTFAVTLGMILSEEKSALYVNMEGCHGFEAFADLSEAKNLTDLIYMKRMNAQDSKWDVRSLLDDCITRWDPLCVLNPPPLSCDLGDISSAEWSELLDDVKSSGEYAAIVLDIGSSIRDTAQLLDQCERIYLPVLEDRISQGKVAQFEMTLDKTGYSRLKDRICKVAVPRLRSDSELSAFPRQLLRGRIGSYVRHVVSRNG